jgi:hypothetical protein
MYHISLNSNLKNLLGYHGTHVQVTPFSKMPAVESVARVKCEGRCLNSYKSLYVRNDKFGLNCKRRYNDLL